MKILLVLVLLLVCGCSNPVEYVDESKIPHVAICKGSKSGTEVMGELYPHIIIAGNKLDYNEKDKWYHYAGSTERACWLEFGGSATEPPERMLGVTTRINYSSNGETVEQFDPKTLKWVPYTPSSDEPPPPPNSETWKLKKLESEKEL